MKSILIVGGAGFIGSHLCDVFVKKGIKVVAFDNLLRGSKKNIAHLLSNQLFSFIVGDARDTENLIQIIKKHHIDAIYHLAANSDIQASSNNPQIEFENTLSTTWSILMAMKIANVKNLFFSSTSAVYGDQNFLLSEENTMPRPISYYGGCKLASENIIKSFSHMIDLNALIFRFPNVVGPRSTHGVIYDFIQKLRKTPDVLEVLGDGSQEKPYLYVADLIDAISIFDEKFPKGFDIYNIGLNTKTSVRRISEIVIDAMKLPNVKTIFGEGSIGWKGDVPKFQYNLSKIDEKGWKAKFSSDQAIEMAARSIVEESGENI